MNHVFIVKSKRNILDLPKDTSQLKQLIMFYNTLKNREKKSLK